MVMSTDNWDEIINDAFRDGTVPSSFNTAQRQMLVPELRDRGMSHEEACSRLGVSDKGGNNAFRVAHRASPLVADLRAIAYGFWRIGTGC